MEDRLYSMLGAAAGMIILVLAVMARQWYLEYSPPKWRRNRWEEKTNRVIHFSPWWQPWYAWRPVKTVSGQIVWLDTVYRCIGNDYVDYDDWRWYHYGNTFDVLRYPE